MKPETTLLAWAKQQAQTLLSPLGNRWLHTKGVVKRAQQVGQALREEDRQLLIAAAYLHDIGYAPQITQTGFHPVDGASYLLAEKQQRLASLIAYHSEAQFEARLRGLADVLDEIPPEQSAIADALTYCDMTTGPAGECISLEERLADIFQRYEDTHIVNRAIRQATPSLTRAITRTQHLLNQHTLTENGNSLREKHNRHQAKLTAKALDEQ